MPQIGWFEILIIVSLAIIVVGPKDFPVMLKKIGSWIKIKNDLDHYKGFIKNKKFTSNQKDTHKIYKLYANLYSKPSIKSKIKKKISYS